MWRQRFKNPLESLNDVMYPENTATRLTSRDFVTLYALYGLENGAFIR